MLDTLSPARGSGGRGTGALAVPRSLRAAAAEWFSDEDNQKTALIGGAVLGGLVGALAAGAAIAFARTPRGR